MSTIDYYNENAEEYYKQTVEVDMQELYKPFMELLPEGSHILDAGCGSGRDTLFFIKKGYQVTAIDGSEVLAQKSSQLTGQKTIHLKFEDLSFKSQFEGIWACASLLHIPKKDMKGILKKLSDALKVNGVLYVSFKYGDKEEVRSGRRFSYYNEDSFERLLKTQNELSLESIFVTKDVRPNRSDEKWLNALIKKQFCNNNKPYSSMR